MVHHVISYPLVWVVVLNVVLNSSLALAIAIQTLKYSSKKVSLGRRIVIHPMFLLRRSSWVSRALI